MDELGKEVHKNCSFSSTCDMKRGIHKVSLIVNPYN